MAMGDTVRQTSGDSRRLLGGTGLDVFPLGVGTNKWAAGTNDEAVWEVFHALVGAGVDFIDTAELYQSGRSESLLGACLEREGKSVVVGTKFRPESDRLTHRQFKSALDDSLGRLGLESLDLYHIHFAPPGFSLDTLMDWMAEAVQSGRVRTVGVSNLNATQMRQAAARLATHGIPLAANQVEYSLFHRAPETDGVLDACRELDVALVAYRPLGRGQLATVDGIGGTSAGEATGAGETGTVTAILQAIAERRGKTMGQVALNWLLGRDEHVIPIPGTTNARHGLENLGAVGWELSADEIAEIDAASSV